MFEIKCVNIKKDLYRAGEFHEDFAWIQNQDGLYGFINTSGEIEIPCKYKNVGYFARGLASVQNSEGLWGYINKSGEEVIKCQFEKAYEFNLTSNALTCVIIPSGEKCIIDMNGTYHLKLDKKYEELIFFDDGTIYATDGKGNIYKIDLKTGNIGEKQEEIDMYGNGVFINHKGDRFGYHMDGIKDKIVSHPYNYIFKYEKDSKFGFINTNREQLIGPIFDTAGDFNFDAAIVSTNKEENIGFITLEGNIKLFSRKYQYKDIRECSEYRMAVQNIEGKWGYIGIDGKEVCPCIYKSAGDFNSGLAQVTLENGDIGFIDDEYKIKIVIPSYYESMIITPNGTIKVEAIDIIELEKKKIDKLKKLRALYTDNSEALDSSIEEAKQKILSERKALKTNKGMIL